MPNKVTSFAFILGVLPLVRTAGAGAEDECERGHEYRPQPRLRGLDDRLEAWLALVLELLRELDDQDRVLGGEADQDDEADLREDVVVGSDQPDAGDGREETHGH